ncbi:MAG: DUF4245 family protein [Actinomycetales bacterium]|nr:DUF4245 family protein [Actinomycetales bacterium]
MAKKRGRESARDMIFSMGAVLLTVLVILGVTYRSHNQQMPKADFSAALATAKTAANWPILVPTLAKSGTPEGYQLTQARFEAESYGQVGSSRWYLGYQDNHGEFVSIWQSDGSRTRVIAAASNDGNCSKSIEVKDATWSYCQQVKPLTRTIYRDFGEYLVVISGTVSESKLVNLAESLVAVKKS